MPGANPNTTKRTTPRRPRPASATTVTSAAEWSASSSSDEGVVIELPSGRRVRATRLMNLPILMSQGRIPNPLASIIEEMTRDSSAGAKALQEDHEANMQMLVLIEYITEQCLLEPKALRPPVRGVSPVTGAKFEESDEGFNERLLAFEEILGNPQKHNTVSTEWIDLADKTFLFYFSQGGAADLANFREASSAVMAGVSASQAVLDKTE